MQALSTDLKIPECNSKARQERCIKRWKTDQALCRCGCGGQQVLFLLQESVTVLVNNSNDVLYYSEDQSFPGPITAPALRVDAAHFGTLKINMVRGRQSRMR